MKIKKIFGITCHTALIAESVAKHSVSGCISRSRNKCGTTVAAILSIAILPLLSACSEYDLQGINPQEYYTSHPIANKVEVRHQLVSLEFVGSSNNLVDNYSDIFFEQIGKIKPNSVAAITLEVTDKVSHNHQQMQYIKNLLRKSGYTVPIKVSVGTAELPKNGALIDFTYAAVIQPDCPDWKRSPVTTYSNTLPANFGCASTVNLGLMIDNPRDLILGQDSRISGTERSSKVLSDYRAGMDIAAGAATSSASTAP